MTQRRVRCALAVAAIVAAAGLAPSMAVGAPHVHRVVAAKNPPAPSSGHWVMENDEVSSGIIEVTSGSFTITGGHQRYVKSLRATIGPGAETACGTGTIRVVGKHKLYDAKGTVTLYNATYNSWIVGTHNSTGIHEQKVTLARGGKRFKGGLKMAFTGRHGGKQTNKGGEISGGDIVFANKAFGSGCELDLGYKKG